MKKHMLIIICGFMLLLLRIKVGKFGVSEKAGDTGRMML